MADLFRTQVRDEPSFGGFCVQQIAVPVSALVFIALTAKLLARPGAEPMLTIGSRIAEVIIYSFAASGAGASAAIVVRGMFGIPKSGRWVWVIPCVLVGVGLISDSIRFSTKHGLSELFFLGPGGEDGWAFFLCTCPTIACITYAAVIRAWTNSASS